MERNLRLRRAIVLAMYDYFIPQKVETLLNHDALMAENPDPMELTREWNKLQDAGILIPVPGYSGVYCSLAAHIRADIDAGRPLRKYPELYGPAAM